MRELFLGSAPAAALGLLLGGMARPELAIEQPRPMEPAQVAYVSAPYEPPAYAATPPSYVLGTDWTRRSRIFIASSYVEPTPPEPADYAYAEHASVDASATEIFNPPPSYPSVDGDILAGIGSAEPPVIETAAPEA